MRWSKLSSPKNLHEKRPCNSFCAWGYGKLSHWIFLLCNIPSHNSIYIWSSYIIYSIIYPVYIFSLLQENSLYFKFQMRNVATISYKLYALPIRKTRGGSTSSLSCIVYVVLHSYFIIHNAPDLTLLTHSCYLLYSICLSQWNQLCTITGEPREDIIWIWIAIASKLWKVQ